MDTKALAKSKRAHSLHHSKKHNTHNAQQALKAPSISSNDKKASGKQAKEKPQQSHNSRQLPSNWDRYSKDPELGSQDVAEVSSSHPNEFVAPKSKGADYAHLVSEAKAQAQAHYPSDTFPFSEGNTYDFTQDFGPMLAAKGQNILSWIADDSFDFESKLSSNFEVPFLSLNLNALAVQLEKVKLSERLLLEPDLLPLELLDNELQPLGEDKHDSETCRSIPRDSGPSLIGHNLEATKNILQHPKRRTEKYPVQSSNQGLNSMTLSKDEILKREGRYGSTPSDSTSKHDVAFVAATLPKFEAASAEAELDMLLNSFSETNIFEPPIASSKGISPISTPSAESVQKGMHIMNSSVMPTDIDDLLEETSNLVKIDGTQLRHGVKAAPDVSSNMYPNSNTKLLDDFDSWLDTI